MESVNVGVVHQEKITGFTVGLLWDAPVLITYVRTSFNPLTGNVKS